MALVLNSDLRYTEHRFGAGLILLSSTAYVLRVYYYYYSYYSKCNMHARNRLIRNCSCSRQAVGNGARHRVVACFFS